MAKPKRRKATIHSAGKVTEQELLENARALYEDPMLAAPICEKDRCVWFSPVKAARKAILKVHAARDDERALSRYANGGNELARAYAATLLLAKTDKIPIVADLRLPGESVPYVMRGKAKPFQLAGLQHHDDRALRLLAVAPWARKRGLHFYSAQRGVVCTGAKPAPPADFVAEEADLVGLQQEGASFTCGHGGDRIVLRWLGSDAVFERCESCAGDGSLLADVRRHVAVPRVEKQFSFEAKLRPLQGSGVDAPIELPPAARSAYLGGKLGDKLVLDAARKARVGALKAGAPSFVAGETHYSDADAFLRALAPSPDVEPALRAALAAHTGSVVIDRPTLARAVAELWPEHGRRMLEAVSDATTAQKLHKEKPQADEAVELIRRAAREGSGRAALSALPAYAKLPPAASAADAIARAFRGKGRDAAIRVAQERASDSKTKGVTLAMLTALQARSGHEWRFTPSDQDVAAALAAHAEALLRGPAESYHDALVAASRGSGETGEIVAR